MCATRTVFNRKKLAVCTGMYVVLNSVGMARMCIYIQRPCTLTPAAIMYSYVGARVSAKVSFMCTFDQQHYLSFGIAVSLLFLARSCLSLARFSMVLSGASIFQNRSVSSSLPLQTTLPSGLGHR